jgi:hypothetical protein
MLQPMLLMGLLIITINSLAPASLIAPIRSGARLLPVHAVRVDEAGAFPHLLPESKRDRDPHPLLRLRGGKLPQKRRGEFAMWGEKGGPGYDFEEVVQPAPCISRVSCTKDKGVDFLAHLDQISLFSLILHLFSILYSLFLPLILSLSSLSFSSNLSFLPLLSSLSSSLLPFLFSSLPLPLSPLLSPHPRTLSTLTNHARLPLTPAPAPQNRTWGEADRTAAKARTQGCPSGCQKIRA